MKFLAPYAPQYPSHVFTGLSGELMRSLTIGGGAAEIVGTVLIAIISFLTQGIADVVWPNSQKSPIGVSGMVIAPSGFGKSVILKMLMNAIEQCLLRMSQIDEKFLDFLIEDATREAIVESLSRFPVAGLLTDEAGQLQHLFRHTATLVKLLDGAPLRNARVSTGRKALFGERLTMLLMAQPDVFEVIKHLFLPKGGVGAGNRLFYAPCNGLVAGGSLHHVGLNESVELAYNDKVAALLDATIKQVEKQTSERPALCLSDAATQCLLSLGDEVRRKCFSGSPWYFISEYVSRHAERVLRLAGALHVFEYGTEGEISADTIQCAASLGAWYIEAYAQMVYEPPKPTQAETDAIELERAIHQFFHSTGSSVIRQSAMRSTALNLGLTPSRFTRALATLGGQGKVRVVMQRNTPWVEFNGNHFSQYW